MRFLAATPAPALWLGIAGILPFYACLAIAALGWAHHPLVPINAMAIYAAVVLSFLGAAWWGLAVHAPPALPVGRFYVWGAVGVLLGWGALMLPTNKGLALLMAGYLGQNLVDHGLAFRHPSLFPRWLLSFRRALTIGVVLALILASALLP